MHGITSRPTLMAGSFLVDPRTLVIPVRYPSSSSVVLGVWMAIWALSEAFLVMQLVAPTEAAARTFPTALLPALLTVMTLAGLFVGYQLLWTLLGREWIRIDKRTLKFRREFLGLGRWDELPVEAIEDVKVEAFEEDQVYPSWGRRFVGKEGYQLVLRTHYRRIPLGRGLDEIGARHLRDFILDRISTA